jgi:hypothetical protein
MPTWVTRRILDGVGKLADLYYRHKYSTMARRLGRPDVKPTDQRGFIILQIDGLSYLHLKQALDEGHMPYLQRLLDKRRMTVEQWRCGLPSNTPAFQAGLMFGNRFDIPGYRWYEKDRRMPMMPQRLDQVRVVRDRISQGRTGILHGGSCYVSMFDGDADLALFTLSSLQRQHFFESVRGIGLLLLFLLNPFRVLRTLAIATGRYLFSLGCRLVALVRPSVLDPLDFLSPLVHAIADALFTEVQTFGVMLDLYRSVPFIYANYTSYDEIAHQLGPDHRAAFRALDGVDKRIRQIDRMRSRFQERKYDLYLLSDHGNTPSIPFRKRSGMTLGEQIAAHIGKEVSLAERAAPHAHVGKKARYLSEELHALEKRAAPRVRRVIAAARRYVNRKVMDQKVDYDLSRQQDVVVSASGPLAHIYFNVSQRGLDLIEVMLLYPNLLENLFATDSIGAMIGRADERTLVLGQEGGLIVIDEEQDWAKKPNPLTPYGDVAYTAAQIHRVAHFPHAGDLILLGAIEPDEKIVSFELQVATHGGLGGPQGYPFIAWSPERRLRPETLNDAQDLYPYFMQYHAQPQNTKNPPQVEGDQMDGV